MTAFGQTNSKSQIKSKVNTKLPLTSMNTIDYVSQSPRDLLGNEKSKIGGKVGGLGTMSVMAPGATKKKFVLNSQPLKPGL